MTPNILLLTCVIALGGCATSATHVAAPNDLGAMATDTVRRHVRAVRDHLRAERQAVRAAFGLGQPVARVIDIRTPAGTADDPEEAPIATAAASFARGHPARDPAATAIQMDIAFDEMLTPEGGLHPRAAQALARMESMARDEGGEFTVSVPRSRIHTATAIRQVAPGATILSTDDESFRLVVIPVGR